MIKVIEFPPAITFPNTCEPREQALKVLEEVSELVEAVKEDREAEAKWEFCDVLQAMGNLVNSMGWQNKEIAYTYGLVCSSNIERGRYDCEDDRNE